MDDLDLDRDRDRNLDLDLDYGTTAGVAPDPARTGLAEAARQALTSTGVHLMPPDAVTACTGTDQHAWERFRAHWENLSPDRYAAESGTCRLRRYGHFSLAAATGELTLLPHIPFVQPQDTNPLYVQVDRYFDPLTDAFAADPVLRSLIRLLGGLAACLDQTGEWSVKVHPFRVIASADGQGEPTPEGLHRDGVTLVSSLLVGRRNADGGESSVFDPDGKQVLATTLSEPGTLLLGDDRRTLHQVSPIRPLDPGRPAYRDVLVTTLTPR
ncbi:2OG-Fe dioxygenase family protein [Streptomyces sp. ISL-100]|uniref:2OG-Fe dioxygenase family protein n=1 Tax=Streptomyces sp. ISL-100 TaxID=2819173 RepID=UPI001BEBCCAC|nr:2OG-Fe dioxygenase family protein [Streptomyces sp. ISL-100]MBT2394926.1 2OG-Fe dioxygenase family protein [Streptomyces sp. ISL-100]